MSDDSRGNAAPDGNAIPGEDDADWREFFGFEEPYDDQADAVEAAIDVARENGFLAMEGPCGTGKTMAALTAAATLVRGSDAFDNVLVVTPVKQQLHQFVDDLRAMNAGLDEPLSGVALVGKSDLCPYGREGAFPADVGVHSRCEDLREATAELVETRGRQEDYDTAGTVPASDSAIGAVRDGADVWWDPERALDLVREARLDAETYRTLDDSLSTAGAESPYPRSQPTAPEEMAESGDPPLFCPFEADWYARNKGSPVDFDAGEEHVVTIEEYLPGAVERGTCPHRAMGVLLENADVVIGNYNHLFDPGTRPLTAAVLDERTFVIVDEAHRLEERVRDLLSDTIGRQTLRRARGDLRVLLRTARQSREARERVEIELEEFDVPLPAVERAADFYDDVVDWLDRRVTDYIESEFADVARDDDLPAHDLEIPLRDPEVDEPDELTEWAEARGYGRGLWTGLSTVGKAAERALDLVQPDRNCVCTAVGALLGAWRERGHGTFFREIELEHSPSPDRSATRAWERVYTPRLLMFNCMPARALADVFGSLGGGVLMSATLEPLDVFRRVSGLDALSDPERGEGRPVEERTYELSFPPENRASWIVDATPFTARNRGPPDVENRNDTREEYARVLREVATSPGNVMLCLPSYAEAAWAADRLREEIDEPVLADESSSAEATDRLKAEFFEGGDKVLVTSTRGTLTEGLDYDGDKLHACAVIGVPLVDIGSPRVRAIRRAYGEAFGEDHAFEYALTVPAVRRARQAIGRVIRGPGERGVRVLVDERYTSDAHFGSVHGYLPAAEREEFVRMTPMFLRSQFEGFWDDE